MLDTAKYKIIESEKASALWFNGSTFTRQVRDPGSTPGGARQRKVLPQPALMSEGISVKPLKTINKC
ncbi:hypothetical protein J6590_031027 [Homalodisca vitripennis]|nr:hypothetical protein J6590_031027 [Homalodisca vitripennis]